MSTDPISWLRIEPDPTDPSVEATLAAPVADPLWLLHCQWRAGELGAHDGGSPVLNDIEYAASTITRLRTAVPGVTAEPVTLPRADLPLEYLVESEPEPGPRFTARSRSGEYATSYPSRGIAAARAGQHLLRLLAGHPAIGDTTAYVRALTSRFPIPTHGSAAATPLLRTYAGRVPDGQALYDDLLGLRHEPPSWPLEPARTGLDDAALRRVLLQWLDWYEATSSIPDSAVAQAPTWSPRRMEYAFDVAAPGPGAETVLRADEYPGDGLDWWDFDLLASAVEPAGTAASLGTSTIDPAASAEPGRISSLASPVRYRGAPDPRWWTFEDAAVNFGDIDAPAESSTTSIVLEFALVYSNDHYLVPWRLPVGELRRVTRLLVTDTFGERVRVPAAADLPRNRPFRLFEHTLPGGSRDPLLFLAPTSSEVAESQPIEEVHYTREEQSQMVWAIEALALGGPAGTTVDRSAEARPRYHELPRTPPTTEGQPDVVTYFARTDVEENWYAFGLPYPLASRTPGTSMPYLTIPALDGTVRPAPWGAVLRSQLDSPTPSLAQEEITRDGRIVSRVWRSTRGVDGSHHTWVARRTSSGRGESTSGLTFDVAQ